MRLSLWVILSLDIRVPLMWTQDDHNKTKAGLCFTPKSSDTVYVHVYGSCLGVFDAPKCQFA